MLSYARNSTYDIYLNSLLIIAIKLNHGLMDEPDILLQSIQLQIKKPNVVHLTNSLSYLGYSTKHNQHAHHYFKHLHFPCLLTKGMLINKETRILFRENNNLICYNPSEHSAIIMMKNLYLQSIKL